MGLISVKELRQQKELTPFEMACKLGIALSTYFDKEAGRRKFKPDEIVLICTEFNIRVEEVTDFCLKNTRNADIRVERADDNSDSA